jgi:hypothetical protein
MGSCNGDEAAIRSCIDPENDLTKKKNESTAVYHGGDSEVVVIGKVRITEEGSEMVLAVICTR